MLLKKIFMLLMLIKRFCGYFFIYYIKFFLGFLVWHRFFECGPSIDVDLLWLFLSSGGFVVAVLVDFGVVLWCGWRMALRCWNERERTFCNVLL